MSHILKERYQTEIVPDLGKSLNLENVMQVPRVKKVVINIGVGEALENSKALDAAVNDVTQIAGQKPIITRARTSIANFKLREGRAIGVKVTLRGEKMWAFLDRLMNVALPRVRDFRGISTNSFDGRGNFTATKEDYRTSTAKVYAAADCRRGQDLVVRAINEGREAAREIDRDLMGSTQLP